MGGASMVAASHLRRNVRSSILITVLLAITVAVVLAALAGARRTDAAIGRFVAADRGADGYAAFPVYDEKTATSDLTAEERSVAAVAGVARTARFSDAYVQVSGPTVPRRSVTVQGFIGMEPGALAMASKLRLVDGRRPDDHRAGEVLIDEELARDAQLAVGDAITVRAFTPQQIFAGETTTAAGFRTPAEVVGIVRRPTDLRDPQTRQVQPNDYVVHQDMYLTTAFWDATHGDLARFTPFVAFDVEPGVDLHETLATMTRELGAYSIDQARFLELDGTYNGVGRSASLHSRALQVFAAVVALAGLFLVGQTLGRQITLEGQDDETLLAMGVRPRQLRLAALLRAAPMAIGGAVLGAIGAVLLSPLTPLPGTVARRAEIHPGLSFDAPVVLGGAAIAAVMAVVVAVLPALRAGRWTAGQPAPARRPTLASRLAARGLPAPAVVGVRFALEPGRGRAAVPVRSAIAAAAAAVAVVLGAITFTTSLSSTRDEPSRYGVTWDVAAGAMSTPDEAAAAAARVGRIPGVRAFAGMGATAYDTPFGEIPAVMLRQERGDVHPLITDGRAPRRGEVALGALTMREEGLGIGDELRIVDSIAGRYSFRIVGEVVLNVAGVDVSIPPGRGALFDWSMLSILSPEGAEQIAPSMFLVDTEPGRTEAVARELTRLFPTSTRIAAVEPFDLTNLGDASLLPRALALVVGLLGIGTVVHAMLSAVRRRQRELAVLKVAGFVRSDTRRTVGWQAVTFGVVALVVGVPLGIAGGRVAWAVAAGQLGIPSYPVVPGGSIALVAAGFVVVLVLAALVPARLAGRVPAAEVLRRD